MVDVNEKIKSLELSLERMKRRAKKHAYGLISPIPISKYSENLETDVIRFMFPATGTISDIIVFIEEFPKDGVNIIAELYSGNRKEAKQTLLTKRLMVLKDSFNVSAGDRVVVRGENVKDAARGIWISFLWTPTKNYVESMKFMIDALEEMENAEKTGEGIEA